MDQVRLLRLFFLYYFPISLNLSLKNNPYNLLKCRDMKMFLNIS